jgi:hypothetical protein
MKYRPIGVSVSSQLGLSGSGVHLRAELSQARTGPGRARAIQGRDNLTICFWAYWRIARADPEPSAPSSAGFAHAERGCGNGLP